MSDTRPRNLLILLWDELQRDTLGLYGGPVPTPACDALGQRGVVFDRYYCANPLCVPTRPSMAGGRWPHAHGSRSFGKGYDTMHPGEKLLFDRLLDADYHIGYEGIWHIIRAPQDDRSDEFAYFKPTGFAREQYLEMLIEQGGKDGDQSGPAKFVSDDGVIEASLSIPVPARWTRPLEEHLDMQHALNIADFIRNAPEDRPFAAWCSLGVPHPPLLVPDEFMDLFDAADMTPPPGFGEDRSAMPEAVAEAPGYQCIADWGWDRWAPAIAAYWGFVAFGDACHQVLLDALEDSGRADDTLVIMTCDHGEMLGAHNLYQKGCMYRDAIRLPFVISGPGIEPGRRSQLASQTDMAPTVLELLGLPPLSRAQGQSLVPIIADEKAPGPDYTFSEFNGQIEGGFKERCCISERYKYAYYHGDPIDQLFDLHNDPDELNNLATDPAHAEVRRQMRAALADWMAATDDYIEPHWPD